MLVPSCLSRHFQPSHGAHVHFLEKKIKTSQMEETTLVVAPFDMPLANGLERCPFSLVTTGRAMVADWPVTSLAPQIECPRLGRHRQIALKLLMDPRLNSRCPPRLRPLPSLALNVLLLGDTNIAMASSTATTKTSSKRTGAAANGAATPTPGSPEAIAANDRDFFWTYTEEPHRTRRLAIIKAHPEACCRWIPLLPGKPSSNNVSPRSPSSAVPNP